MHLLSTLEATAADVDVAVDLDQTPGQIVFLSAADSELACLARAQARLPDDAPTLRLANLLQLAHPMSVDLYADRVVARARLVVLRLLGGRGYWPYGVEQLAATCRAHGVASPASPATTAPTRNSRNCRPCRPRPVPAFGPISATAASRMPCRPCATPRP